MQEEPFLLGVDQGDIHLDGSLHQRMHDLSVRLDAEVSDPPADFQKFPLLDLQLAVDLFFFPGQRFDQRAGCAAMGVAHEVCVGTNHSRRHSR